MLGDLGHSRPRTRKTPTTRSTKRVRSSSPRSSSTKARPPKNGSVTAYTQTCPTEAPAARPVHRQRVLEARAAHDHASARPHRRRSPRPVATRRSRPSSTRSLETPKRVQDGRSRNRARHRQLHDDELRLHDAGPADGHRDRQTRPGCYGEIAARLWDVLPSGEQRLISRGIYRLAEDQTGTITFQLHGNGYEFAGRRHGQAPAARARRALLPRQQRRLQRRSERTSASRCRRSELAVRARLRAGCFSRVRRPSPCAALLDASRRFRFRRSGAVRVRRRFEPGVLGDRASRSCMPRSMPPVSTSMSRAPS